MARVVLVLALAFVAVPAAQSRPSLDLLFDTYKTGDYNVVYRTLRNSFDFDAYRPELTKMATDALWDRTRAVFLMEFAVVAFRRSVPPASLLTPARTYVVKRPDKPGEYPLDDTFEIAWQKTAVSLLHGFAAPGVTIDWLTRLEQRFGSSRFRQQCKCGGLADAEPRFALMRAIAAEQLVSPRRATGLASGAFGIIIPPPASTLHKWTTDALKLYDAAAKHAANVPEASVRRAYLLSTSRPETALSLLDAYAERTDDTTVVYWGRLFRGRALESLGRPDDAAEAYRAARTAWPSAQSPAVALAALMTSRNLRAEALTWADRAGAGGAETFDPWWWYWLGDYRLAVVWLDELRKMAR